MSPGFVHRETVRWSDVDAQGVLNNAVFLTLLEQARFGYFGALDLIVDQRFPFVLGSTSVRFERPGRAGMELTIDASVTRLGGASFDMEYSVRCGAEVLATATATLVWVDAELAAQRIPEPVRRAIRAREGWAAGADRAAVRGGG